MKKSASAIIIIVCLFLAFIGFYKFFLSSGTEYGTSSGEMTWVKCKSCNAEYQMKLVDYYDELKENTDPKMVIVTPGLKCKECGKNTVYQAIKCPNCGTVFIKGSVPGKPEDTCPKCKYSATEESRKNSKPAA